MTTEEAHTLVGEYERSGSLPNGFTAKTSTHKTKQGSDYKVVIIQQNNVAVISYTVKDGHIEGDIDLV